MQKKISIIIPVYNVEKYLEQCLDSIINQTYKNIEVLLIDDGSTDNSANICDEYAKRDPRFIVFHQKNSGVSRARNLGLDNISGDYVMFVDSDDWLELNACEVLMETIIKSKSEIVVFNFYNEYEKYSEKNKLFKFDNKDNNLNRRIQAKVLAPSLIIPNFDVQFIGYTWNKIIKSSLAKKNKFMFEKMQAIYEDGLYYYELFEYAKNIYLCNEYLYHYRILQNSAVRRYNNDFVKISDEIYKKIKSFEKKHKNDSFYKQSLYVRVINNFCNMLNLYVNNKNHKISFFERKKIIKNELTKQQYIESLKNINTANLNKKLRIYHRFLKLKLYSVVIIINNIEQILKKMNYRMLKKINN